jgi:glycosyltransferase involved in cell wall biosynthesis
MKIIYLHQYFNTPDMSGGTRSFEMARRMVKSGHEVHLVTSSRSGQDSATGWVKTNEEGITVHWYPVPYSNSMSFVKRVWAFIAFAAAAFFKTRELRADVIFASSTPLTIAVPGVLVSKVKRIPFVFEVRDLWPELPIAAGVLKSPFTIWTAKRLERWAYNNSTAVVALSPGMKAGVVRLGYPSSRVAVIPNSSDVDAFDVGFESGLKFRAERPWLGQSPLLLYTGTFGSMNRVSYLVSIAYELAKLGSSIKILAIGGGSEFLRVQALAEDAGVLDKNFFLEPRIQKKDIPAAYAAATLTSCLFLDLPEMQNNSANKFFDSLAAGKPIVLNYGGWMHDMVIKNSCGIAGWRLPDKRVAEILEEKVRDTGWLRFASANALDLGKRAFNRDDLAEKLLRVLEHAASGAPDLAERIAPGNY